MKSSVLFLCWLFFCTAYELEYIEKKARDAFAIAAASYGSEDCDYINIPQENFKILFRNETVCIEGKPKCKVLAISQDKDKMIWIGFRGPNSESKIDKDFLRNLQANTEFLDFGLIDKNFVTAQSNIWPIVELVLKTPNTQNYNIIYTGHSTGGALAVLSALQSYKIGIPENLIHVFTFGEPRIGNKVFSNNVDRSFTDIWRIVNTADIVPHITPCRDDYNEDRKGCDELSASAAHHHSTEVWYHWGMKKGIGYRICTNNDEDSLCSDSLKNFKDKDHFKYFEMDIGEQPCNTCQYVLSYLSLTWFLLFSFLCE